jgi:hypothetical protein
VSGQRLCLWKNQVYGLTFKKRKAILARPTQLVFTTLWKGVDKASFAGPETLVCLRRDKGCFVKRWKKTKSRGA